MNTCKVSDLFKISSGNGFELNSFALNSQGINFVARGSKDNGVVAKVNPIIGIPPFPAGAITVAASGSVMESFLQTEPFYTSYHIFILTPKENMNDAVKLFYCMCLRKNKFKYSYGRQANETLADLQIPRLEDIPFEFKNFSLQDFKFRLINSIQMEDLNEKSSSSTDEDELVPLTNLFSLHNGISSDKVIRSNKSKSENWIPFIRPSFRQSTSIDSYVNKTLIPENKVFSKGTLYVSTNGQGSHTYSYVSATEFVPNSDVCVLLPLRPMCIREKLFYAMCISKNRFKFSYGRKPKGKKLEEILLPKTIPKEFNDIEINVIINSFI